MTLRDRHSLHGTIMRPLSAGVEALQDYFELRGKIPGSSRERNHSVANQALRDRLLEVQLPELGLNFDRVLVFPAHTSGPHRVCQKTPGEDIWSSAEPRCSVAERPIG